MEFIFDEETWAACYADKFPNVDNNVKFNEETGEYQFIHKERR